MTTRPNLGERIPFAHRTIAQRDPARAARLLGALRGGSGHAEMAVAAPPAPPGPGGVAALPPTDGPATAPPPRCEAARTTSRRYRRISVFQMPGAIAWRPLDRNQRAKLWTIAQSMERRTKEKGHRNGCLGSIGLRILNCLLYRFLNGNSGRCDPSYDALQQMTGFCRQSIAKAIDRLEAAGLLTVTRRMIRVREQVVSALTGRTHDCVVVRQISNAYALTEPNRALVPSRNEGGRVQPRPFPHRRDPLETALALLLRSIVEPSLSGRGQSKHPSANSQPTDAIRRMDSKTEA